MDTLLMESGGIAIENIIPTLLVLVHSSAKTTLFRKEPMPEMDTSICVPGTRYLGGFKPAPTP
jgi:hypothetical protein